MIKCYKYRIYPNNEQQILIQKTFGCVRFVYNYYLNMRIENYKKNKTTFRFNDCCKDLTNLKKQYEWLKEVDKCALQNSLKNLEDAYKNFFNYNKNFPKFKSKKRHRLSYKTQNYNMYRKTQAIMIQNNRIKLPKLGWVKARDRQIIKGRILSAIVSQEPTGYYYVSLCCSDVEIQPLPKTYNNVGIDLGIKDFAVFSDKTIISNPKFYEKLENRLAKLHKELDRKSRNGSNWNKARIKLAKLYKHITNQRQDFLQKLTTNIVKEYDIICIEDLNVQKLRSSINSIHNKRINDVAWYQFHRLLEYKCNWYGKELRVVDRGYPSSRICHVCGYNGGEKSTEIRLWVCNCGALLDRDINAAINILNEGLKQIA